MRRNIAVPRDEFGSDRVMAAFDKYREGIFVLDVFDFSIEEISTFGCGLKFEDCNRYFEYCLKELDDQFYAKPDNFNYPYEKEYERNYEFLKKAIYREKEECLRRKKKRKVWHGTVTELAIKAYDDYEDKKYKNLTAALRDYLSRYKKEDGSDVSSSVDSMRESLRRIGLTP